MEPKIVHNMLCRRSYANNLTCSVMPVRCMMFAGIT
uniref:Uncharacterized protein n=1 Tax=Anguilla anguilla TaxID=7936 RepID=A0A0E9UVZ7_ANGAN